MHVTFGSAVADFFKRYASFSGRSTRAQYWWVALALILACLAICILYGIGIAVAVNSHSVALLGFAGILLVVFTLGIIIPSLALTARRLHDIGKPAWWIAVWFGINVLTQILSFVGGAASIGATVYGHGAAPNFALIILCGVVQLGVSIWQIVWMCQPSDGDNEYGPNLLNENNYDDYSNGGYGNQYPGGYNNYGQNGNYGNYGQN